MVNSGRVRARAAVVPAAILCVPPGPCLVPDAVLGITYPTRLCAYFIRIARSRRPLAAALAVAARMDRVMEAAPFTKHHELLRLRGMLAVFVADLWVPWRLVARARARAAAEGSGAGAGETKSPLAAVDAVLARAAAAGDPEDRAAVAARRAELDAARGFFARIVEGGGLLEGWVRRFVEAEDDEEEEEDYDEDGDREGGGIHGWYRIHD